MHRISTCVFFTLVALPLFAEAPLHKVKGATAGRYIVTLKPDAPAAHFAESVARSANAALVHTYTTVLNGFSVRANEQKALALTKHPGVAAVWEVPSARADETQYYPPKGLDRIEQHALPLDNAYFYFPNTTTSVTLYIVDTGMDPRPTEFGSRVYANVNFYTGDVTHTRDPNDFTDGGLPLNDSWHGTAVAVVAAGAQSGVARSAAIANVRVMKNASGGSWDDIVAGVQWVTQQRNSRPGEKHVANMSINGHWGTPFTGYEPAITALQASLNAGVAWVFSAGNDTMDACTYFPAWMGKQYSGAITVGAMNPETDEIFSYSNQGPCVEIYAPADVEWGDTQNGSSATGTSAAAPHVAGVFAERWTDASATSDEIEGLIKGIGTPNVLWSIWPNSNNLLLYSLRSKMRACCT